MDSITWRATHVNAVDRGHRHISTDCSEFCIWLSAYPVSNTAVDDDGYGPSAPGNGGPGSGFGGRSRRGRSPPSAPDEENDPWHNAGQSDPWSASRSVQQPAHKAPRTQRASKSLSWASWNPTLLASSCGDSSVTPDPPTLRHPVVFVEPPCDSMDSFPAPPGGCVVADEATMSFQDVVDVGSEDATSGYEFVLMQSQKACMECQRRAELHLCGLEALVPFSYAPIDIMLEENIKFSSVSNYAILTELDALLVQSRILRGQFLAVDSCSPDDDYACWETHIRACHFTEATLWDGNLAGSMRVNIFGSVPLWIGARIQESYAAESIAEGEELEEILLGLVASRINDSDLRILPSSIELLNSGFVWHGRSDEKQSFEASAIAVEAGDYEYIKKHGFH